MRLRRLDLNLVVILDTLLAERNVTRAAEKLGLSQSAVSHALRRLRAEFGDELLTRGSRGMELTWRAGYIRDKLRTALNGLEHVLDVNPDFEPARSGRTFHLCVSDYVSDHLLAYVCSVLRVQAPGVKLHIDHFKEAAPEPADEEIHVRLASDLPAPSTAKLSESAGLHQVRVMDDVFSVLMRRDHPHAAVPMSLDSYLSLSHVKVSASAVGGNMIDEALARRGCQRHIAIRLPSWVHAGPIVQATDLVVAIPRHWASNVVYRTLYCSFPLPLPEVRFAIDVIWSLRFEDDPGHRWMRQVVIDAMQKQVIETDPQSSP